MNAGTGTRRRAGAALLAATTYLTFLVAGAPHRVHHFFDFLETPGTAASAAQPSPDEAGAHSPHHPHPHAHDHHGHGGGTDGHGHHGTSPETSPEPPCVVLAAFEQNPGSFADPPVHSMGRPTLALSFGSVSGPLRAARVQTHHSRAPPHLI